MLLGLGALAGSGCGPAPDDGLSRPDGGTSDTGVSVPGEDAGATGGDVAIGGGGPDDGAPSRADGGTTDGGQEAGPTDDPATPPDGGTDPGGQDGGAPGEALGDPVPGCGPEVIRLAETHLQVAPSGADDTEALGCALSTAALVPGTRVSLLAGTYRVGALDVEGFQGRLDGAGPEATRLEALPEVACEPPYGGLLTFAGGHLEVAELTISVGDARCRNPLLYRDETQFREVPMASLVLTGTLPPCPSQGAVEPASLDVSGVTFEGAGVVVAGGAAYTAHHSVRPRVCSTFLTGVVAVEDTRFQDAGLTVADLHAGSIEVGGSCAQAVQADERVSLGGLDVEIAVSRLTGAGGLALAVEVSDPEAPLGGVSVVDSRLSGTAPLVLDQVPDAAIPVALSANTLVLEGGRVALLARTGQDGLISDNRFEGAGDHAVEVGGAPWYQAVGYQVLRNDYEAFSAATGAPIHVAPRALDTRVEATVAVTDEGETTTVVERAAGPQEVPGPQCP